MISTTVRNTDDPRCAGLIYGMKFYIQFPLTDIIPIHPLDQVPLLAWMDTELASATRTVNNICGIKANYDAPSSENSKLILRKCLLLQVLIYACKFYLCCLYY